MKKIILFCVSILLYSSCEKNIVNEFSPSLITYTPSNLCGIWYGYGYSCALDEIQTEIILIEHDNNFVRATKLVGDNCISSGQVTWEGIINLNSSNTITLNAGEWHGPNIVPFDGIPIVIENLNHITLPNQDITFIRATNEQINNEIQDIYFEAHNTYLNLDLEGICKPQI